MPNPYRVGRPRKYHPLEGNLPPAVPGEYRIRNGSGKIIYIGETCDLNRRTREHLRNGRLTPASGGITIECQQADRRSSSRTRRQHERQKIEQHHPSNNKSRGGEGAVAKK